MAFKDVAKKRAYQRQWDRAWRKDHPEQARAMDKHKNLQRRIRNPEKVRSYAKVARLRNPGWPGMLVRKRKFGLTVDGFHALFEKQGECCAICHVVLLPLDKRTHVDHDHDTNRVRGLLCHGCNTGLGAFKETITLLYSAAAYLEVRSPCRIR